MSQNRQQFPQVMPVPPPEIVTGEMIENCLNIIAALQPFILPIPRDPQSSIPQEAQRLDGESALAATTTFIKSCSKLDALLDDPARWSLDAHKSLYAMLEKNYEQQYQFLRSQTFASNNLSRPSFLYKPEIVQTEDGEFVTYIGDVTSPGCGLLGKGKTPAEAFADFDAAFFRAEQHRLENADPTPKPKRKKK